MAERCRDVLVVDLLGGIGDLVMALPVVHALSRRHPAARVRVLTHEPGAALLREDPHVDEVLVPAHDRAGAEREAVEAAVSARAPDLAVTTTRYDGIPDLLRSRATRCVDDLWRAPPGDQGVSERYLRILHAEGIVPLAEVGATPRLHLTEAVRRRGRAVLSSLAAGAGPPVVLLTDAGMPVKRWPARHWRALADRLANHDGCTVLVVGPAADLAGVPAVPPLSLPVLAGLFAAVGERGGAVVGGDTGPLRVAGAAGAPTVGLFGPTAALRYGIPGGTNLQGLAGCPHRRPTAITDQVCWWTARCPLSSAEPACLADLHPETVAAAVRRLCRGRRQPSGPPRPREPKEGAAMDEFKKGDKVTWNSHGGTAEGTVERKITEDTEAAGRTVRASEDEPQYLVRSEKSGGTAVHKASALKKKG